MFAKKFCPSSVCLVKGRTVFRTGTVPTHGYTLFFLSCVVNFGSFADDRKFLVRITFFFNWSPTYTCPSTTFCPLRTFILMCCRKSRFINKSRNSSNQVLQQENCAQWRKKGKANKSAYPFWNWTSFFRVVGGRATSSDAHRQFSLGLT